MQNVTVAIGRNIDNEPMSARSWRAFQNDVQAALHSAAEPGPTFSAKYRGEGQWQGVREQSVVFSASFEGVTIDREALSGALASIARAYQQDAVALTVGEITFPG
jgi:hypothetical protein